MGRRQEAAKRAAYVRGFRDGALANHPGHEGPCPQCEMPLEDHGDFMVEVPQWPHCIMAKERIAA